MNGDVYVSRKKERIQRDSLMLKINIRQLELKNGYYMVITGSVFVNVKISGICKSACIAMLSLCLRN